jgi:hypothetical protein
MGDPQVERWQQRGTIFMWQDKNPSYPEWNITADDNACDALLDLFDRMENGLYSSKKELRLTVPVKTAHALRPFRTGTHLTIKYPKGRIEDDHWVLEQNGQRLVLNVGLERLRELRDAIVDMKEGGGDYLIGGDQARMWIWWFVREG